MAIPYEIHLAHRNLARQPWHTGAMVLGLALAVLVMVYIPNSMASFYDDLIDRAVEQNSAHVTIWPKEKHRRRMDRILRGASEQGAIVVLKDQTSPRRRNLNGYHDIAARVAETPGVIAVANLVRGNATVSRKNVNLGVVLEGIQPREYSRVVNIAKHFPDGRVPELGPFHVAIGFRLAEKLGVDVGEKVRVATPDTSRDMRVRAVFRSGYYDKDIGHAYVSLATAQRMLQMGNEISAVAARSEELNQAAAVSDSLAKRFALKIRNWMDDNASLLAEVATINRVTFFVNVLVALVASIGMGNVFSMFVLNRQKELAILRAVGGSRASLRVILFIEAGVIWVAGAILGCAGALAVMAWEQFHPYQVSAETYGIGSYATQPKLSAFVVSCALAAGTMAVSAWWSGRRAARLRPAEVIFGR